MLIPFTPWAFIKISIYKVQDKFGLCFTKMSYYISNVYRQKKKFSWNHLLVPLSVKPEGTIVFLDFYQTVCPLFVFQPFSLRFGELISNFLCNFNNDALQIKNESILLCHSIQNSSYLYSSVTCLNFLSTRFFFFHNKITLCTYKLEWTNYG